MKQPITESFHHFSIPFSITQLVVLFVAALLTFHGETYLISFVFFTPAWVHGDGGPGNHGITVYDISQVSFWWRRVVGISDCGWETQL